MAFGLFRKRLPEPVAPTATPVAATPTIAADIAVSDSDSAKEILELLSRGAAYKEIGNRLSLSIHTVRMHIRGIYGKLQVHSRGEADRRSGSSSGAGINAPARG